MLSGSFKILLFLAATSLLLQACVPVSQPVGSSSSATTQPDTNIPLANYVASDNLKTVRLYPNTGDVNDVMYPPIVPLAQAAPLYLEFDDLTGEYAQYAYKIIHCDEDWTPSQLSNLEYLFDYNEFNITQHEFSYNTRTQYVHYFTPLPKVKQPGNYVLQLYRNDTPGNILLTQRFMVYDNQVLVSPRIGLAEAVAARRTRQQVQFTVNYNNLAVLNPFEQVKVVIRKNYRWDNAITNLKPNFVREGQNQLEYEYFDLRNTFYGGNQYRFFDIRMLNALGRNVGKIKMEPDGVKAFLLKDKSRANQPYTQYPDFDGGYVIENVERGTGTGATESDYVSVNFLLETTDKAIGDIYVLGQMNQYKHTEENKLTYDPAVSGYTGDLLLKQGWYDYIYYAPEAPNPYMYEGSFNQTENIYEILVYFRGQTDRTDYLVGYSRVTVNDD
ncbi:DUF5103 domain-containing protein [Roseivirga sp. BDSF3-8]|uniref:type IX secretion system plug protein n=1 Tax=Roseivirga sp. BDSF3-8 TaxID=3241598 RepID=UPI003531C95D